MFETDFTYEKPNEEDYFNTLVEYVKYNDEKEIFNIIKEGKCTIQASSSYSNVRWNGLTTGVYFQIPISKLGLTKQDSIEEKLTKFCGEVMPPEIGFDIKYIEFTPLLVQEKVEKTFMNMDENISNFSEKIIDELLPSDIKEKGNEMAQAYLYLYCIENSLRLFIEKKAKEKFGDEYFNKIHVKTTTKSQIKSRMKDEEENKWISLRGESEIFYLDFKDLENIIRNNKDVFGHYFPDEHWLSVKIKEMTKIRDRIAHNSFIGDHEISVLKNNYESILRQIGQKERK